MNVHIFREQKILDNSPIPGNQIEIYERTQNRKNTVLQFLKIYSQEYLNPEPIKWSAFSGWINVYLFCIQVITGTLLILYYRPTISEAYESVQQITSILHYGWLIRGIHIWAVHLLVISLGLHVIYILINQRYQSTPQITWLLGCLMMVMIGFFATTGHLLPWTQASYWTTALVTQLPTAIPIFGELIKLLARGGSEISQHTLSRFFALHILIIPMLFMLSGMFHIRSIKKSPIPRDLLAHILVLLILCAVLFSLSTFSPPRIHLKADPFHTLLNIKPKWYFLASYGTFELFRNIGWPRMSIILGFFSQFGLFLLFLLFPFLVPSSLRNRRLNMMLTLAGILIFLSLTMLGYYL